MAPGKPAMNDVHPVRKAASGPNASRRYTYSPPECGRAAASSAYALAPATASAPPARKLRVRPRPRERKRAAQQPHGQHRGGVRHQLRDDDGDEEDAAADH